MRPYTIVKTLALSLGAFSVVARSLPEARADLNIRASGRYGFRNPLKELKNTDASVDKAVSEATTLAATTDVDALKQRLERMGLIKISEGILDGKVHTITYSMPNTTFPKRDTTLEKRADKNIEGGRCMTMCTENKDVAARPQPNDCTVLYNELYSQAVQFSVDSKQVSIHVYENCGAFFVNNSPDTVTYDYWDFGGTTQWLTGNCFIGKSNNFGGCSFGMNFESSAYIAVVHPSYFGIF